MPNYKKHLAGGCLIYGLLMFLNAKLNLITLDLNLQLQTLSSCLIGSLFPDIDTKSKLNDMLSLESKIKHQLNYRHPKV